MRRTTGGERGPRDSCPSPCRAARRCLRSAALALALLIAAGCSTRAYVTRQVADAVGSGGGTFGSDDDPQLVREATPFALKLSESLLASAPRHDGLLLSLARGFTQYAAAFVWQDAVESADPVVREAGKARALGLYLRAREYGLRGLEARHPGFRELVAADPAGAARTAGRRTCRCSTGREPPGASPSPLLPATRAMIADLPRCEALLRRALELKEDYDAGAIHEYFVAFEGSRPAAMGGSVERARTHFTRAMELAARAEGVAPGDACRIRLRRRSRTGGNSSSCWTRPSPSTRAELAPEYRQANLAAQRRAAWLKGRVDELFLE